MHLNPEKANRRARLETRRQATPDFWLNTSRRANGGPLVCRPDLSDHRQEFPLVPSWGSARFPRGRPFRWALGPSELPRSHSQLAFPTVRPGCTQSALRLSQGSPPRFPDSTAPAVSVSEAVAPFRWALGPPEPPHKHSQLAVPTVLAGAPSWPYGFPRGPRVGSLTQPLRR
jgi:hypothetical protein